MLKLKITTVIVTNDNADSRKLISILKKIDELSIVGTATIENKGIALITNYAPDLVFIDMELKKTDGIEFAQLLRNRNNNSEIVFLAEDKQRSYDSLKLQPFDYLLRPIDPDCIQQMLFRLKAKLKKKELLRKMNIFSQINSGSPKRIFKQKGGIITIPLDQIVFCKAKLTRSIIVLRCGEEIQLSSSISETYETINNDNFFRIGRSYCINRYYLRKIDKKNFKCHMYYEGKTWEVPISKNSIVQLEKINAYPIY